MTEPIVATAETLPEHWPMTAPVQPVRPWWIPWPIAVVAVPLLWILPKRMGPHFAAVRWPGIIAAHLLWTLYGVACICLGMTAPEYSWAAWFRGEAADLPAYAQLTFSQTARAPVAQVAWELCQEANFGMGWGGSGFPAIMSVADLLIWLSVIVGIELGLVLLAGLLAPYIAAGERTRRLLVRSVKLLLLGTTILFPVSLAVQWESLRRIGRLDDEVVYTLLTALGSAWLCWIFVRSGSRYGGPTEGPAWEPRKVLCEACGYALTGLTVDRNCPECGRPIADSMPANRRPTPLAAARGIVARPAGYIHTLLRSLLRLSFFKHVAVHGDEYTAARRFAVWTAALAFPWGLLVTILSLLPVMEWRQIESNLMDVGIELGESVCIMASVWVFIAIGLLLIFGGLLVLGTRFGRQPTRPMAVVVFYWSAWLLPMIAAAAVSSAIAEAMDQAGLYDGPAIDWGPFGRVDRGVMLIPMPFIALVAPTILCSAYRLLRGSRETRFANA